MSLLDTMLWMSLETALKMRRAIDERRPVFQIPHTRSPIRNQMLWSCPCGEHTPTVTTVTVAECRRCGMLFTETDKTSECGRLASWTLDERMEPVSEHAEEEARH